MPDRRNVRRVEFRRIIDKLERLFADLQDVNAGVSPRRIALFRKLRRMKDQYPTPSAIRMALKLVVKLLEIAATELMKKWIETLICLLSAARPRVFSYDCWPVYQISARVRRAYPT